MKICTVTQSYAPTGGGVRTFIHAQREWFTTHDIDHTLIVPGAADLTERSGRLTTHFVKSPFVPGSGVYRLLLRSRAVLRLLEQERPDVIELHDAYNLPWAAFRHRRQHGGIVAAFYMTDLPVAYVETPLRKRAGAAVAAYARSAAERYLRSLYSRCDAVIAISAVMRERLRSFGVDTAHYVPLGADMRLFSPGRRSSDTRQRLGRDGDLLLVYAGRLDAEKRPDFVLEAFTQLPRALNARLVLAGDGPMRPMLEDRAREDDRITVLPFVQGREELATILASCDVYVSGMAHETFGLSVVEAQACGLPVVGVSAGAMVDRVQDGEGFLVPPDSPAAMAERIVSTPRSAWPAMGRRARERVQHEFSWDRTFDTLLGIYSACLRVENAPARLPL